MLPCCRFLSALGNSDLSALRNSRREAIGASTGRGRQTRTMEEARAFVPFPMVLPVLSVRTGQVPVIVKPALIKPSSIVSQPVEAVAKSVSISSVLSSSDSDCLKAYYSVRGYLGF